MTTDYDITTIMLLLQDIYDEQQLQKEMLEVLVNALPEGSRNGFSIELGEED